MKIVLLFTLLLSSSPTFAKEKNNIDSKAVTLGFFMIFCPVCVPQVANELVNLPDSKKDKPLPSSRGLASEEKKDKK